MVKVVGLGAGGHAAVMIEAIRASGAGEIVGLLDADPKRHGSHVFGIPVLGNDDLLPKLRDEGVTHFFNGIGSVRNTALRQQVFETAVSMGFQPVDVIHPTATISPTASWGPGVAILTRAVVGTRAKLGQNVLVNTAAVVEHDCEIGDHVHIASGAVLTGAVRLGRGVHVGAGAVVLQGVSIGDTSIIGAGAVVLSPVEPGVTAVGVPAKPLAQASHEL